MRKNLLVVIAALVLLGLLVASPMAVSADEAKVNAPVGLKMRLEPGLDGFEMFTLYYGELVWVDENEPSVWLDHILWSKVQAEGGAGWVAAAHLNNYPGFWNVDSPVMPDLPEGFFMVKAPAGLKLREEAGYSTVVFIVPYGTVLESPTDRVKPADGLYWRELKVGTQMLWGWEKWLDKIGTKAVVADEAAVG
jgi:hypothetical protein